jgi:2-polyprenyl-3-methyl-5-hydroxy-6-metoxy-1,4-benzoquinol methylase
MDFGPSVGEDGAKLKIPETLKPLNLLRLIRKTDRPPPVPNSEPVTTYSSRAERIKATGKFGLDDIDLLLETINEFGVVRGTPWDNFRAAHCVLPDWFRLGLDPLSSDYAAQQQRLWSSVTGIERDYLPTIDEKEDLLTDVDAIRRPGYFIRRDADSVEHAAHHVIATGMILKHSGLKPGDSALEYGAGFGQIALTLARLGVAVDTVDISKVFCSYVTEQAAFFKVPLTSFEGQFGWNPRGNHEYDLIFFYESFHHCADFRRVVHAVKRHLAPNGCVLLAGEPIVRTENSYLPYSWGLRLDAESIVQIKRFGWFELGFTEEFLVSLFSDAGFSARRIECEPSIYGAIYAFKHRGTSLEPGSEWLSFEIESGWNNPEPEGRWTKAESKLYLDTRDGFSELVLDATNHHPFTQPVEITYGSATVVTKFNPGERKQVVISANEKAPQIVIRTRAYIPAADPSRKASDSRSLGLFVHAIHYR